MTLTRFVNTPNKLSLGPSEENCIWLDTEEHQEWLAAQAIHQLDFFRSSLNTEGGYHVLRYDGKPLSETVQELHTTTRLVHSYSLGKLAGVSNCEDIIDQGMQYLKDHHRDKKHGGYFWALDESRIYDERKLAYGHIFVLLAGSSAHMAGHPDAKQLVNDVSGVLDDHFWEDKFGLFCDEFNRNWTPFSTYRGMNANMHAVEALLTAYEAFGRKEFLIRAGRILDFFVTRIAPENGWRLHEHYGPDWTIDPDYSANPMFRPAGSTPGHSFEMARLLLQYWDLNGRQESNSPVMARALVEQALTDAWDKRKGGLYYTLNLDGTPLIKSRYWWPVTEAIGVLAALLRLEHKDKDELWYRKLWQFADEHFIDHVNGGWFPEINDQGIPSMEQFTGKPDIYHSLQSVLFPLTGKISRHGKNLPDLSKV